MAKRFTDTGKWEKPWFRKLTAAQKCFWMYLLDKSDHAGIYEVDLELAEFFIGCKIDEDFLDPFEKQIQIIDEGKRWFIRDFISFQYGELNNSVQAHRSVITTLSKKGINPLSTVGQPLPNPSLRVKDKDMDKDKDKDEDQDKDKDRDIEAEAEKPQAEAGPPTPGLLDPEKDLWEKGCAEFGEDPDALGLTTERRFVLRAIRSHHLAGGARFLKACQNRARSPAPGQNSITFFTDNKFEAVNRVTLWAQGGPKYNDTGKQGNNHHNRDADKGDGAGWDAVIRKIEADVSG